MYGLLKHENIQSCTLLLKKEDIIKKKESCIMIDYLHTVRYKPVVIYVL